jgi:3-hydroxyisobutyrate dehydrogenase-like beta-hydroxyacid dehydrogenase
MVFDAFDKQGAGQLATWMILSGNENALNPVVDAIHELIDEIGQGQQDKSMHQDTLTLVLLAMGDALLGEPLARSLGLPRAAARDIATKLLMQSPRLSPGGQPDQH